MARWTVFRVRWDNWLEGEAPSTWWPVNANGDDIVVDAIPVPAESTNETRVMDYVVADDPDTLTRMEQALYGNPEVVSWVVLEEKQP